jgi:tryptophan-rich sensory protein
MSTALIGALILCIISASLEGLAAGSGVRQRFAELRFPRFSPPLPVWIGVGLLYYVMCFAISYRLLDAGIGFSMRGGALALLLLLMGINIVWNVVFFRRKDLHASYFSFWPYLLVALALILALANSDALAAWIFLPYFLYLGYAVWWMRRLWQLNGSLPGAAGTREQQ